MLSSPGISRIGRVKDDFRASIANRTRSEGIRLESLCLGNDPWSSHVHMGEEQSNPLKDLTFRQIGRNVVNLQRFERMLKIIIVQSDVRGYMSELAKVHQDLTYETSKKTLGLLVKEFLNTVYSTDDPFTHGPSDSRNEPRISHGSRIQSNAESMSKRERELREVVEERNMLIHHRLTEVDFNSVDECKELISRLDAQNDRLKPYIDSFMSQLGHMQSLQNELQSILEAELRKHLQAEADKD